jgi:hypothetical protein
MRTPAQWEAVREANTVHAATNAFLVDAKLLTAARAGGLTTAATSGADTRQKLDGDGNPIAGFWAAGMVPGSAPIGN